MRLRERMWSVGLAVAIGAGACANPTQPHVTMAVDGALVAGSESCAAVTIRFETPPQPAQRVELTTTLGVLDPSADTDAARQKKTLTTTGDLEQQTLLCPGLVAGSGRLSATVASVLELRAQTFTILPVEVSTLYVDLDRDTLQAPGSTSTTARASLHGPTPLASTANARVRFVPCCEDTKLPCSDFVTVPPVVDTTGSAPGVAEASVRLTPDGESFTLPSADGSTHERLIKVVAYVSSDGTQPSCADLLGTTQASGVVTGSAELRLTNSTPDGGAP